MPRSPFPGMDPFLEEKSLWPNVHARLIVDIQGFLAPKLWPNYVVQIEEWVYLTGHDDPGLPYMVPDVTVRSQNLSSVTPASSRTLVSEPVHIEFVDPTIRNRFVEIRNRATRRVVTAIEVLSPANKVRGSRGYQALSLKRSESLTAGCHWIEIDLLRAGSRLDSLANRSDYLVALRRHDRSGIDAWFFDLRQEAPACWIPLSPPDSDSVLSIQDVLERTYDQAFLSALVDYDSATPPPLLSEEDEAWVRDRIRVWRDGGDRLTSGER